MAGSGHIDPRSVDLEMLATALADQGGWEHSWLFNPRTGETVFRSSDDPDVDPQTDAVDSGDGRLHVEPLPTWVWYQDMVDFTDQVSDERASRRLARALNGKGAFRRFKDELHQEYPDLLSTWYAFRDARAAARAVEWLRDNDLIDDDQLQTLRHQHPEPPFPAT